VTKLDDRFEALGRATAPDLWREIKGREPRSPVEPGPTLTRRVGVILLAFAIAGSAFALVSEQWGNDQEPAAPSLLSNGYLYYRVGGGDGGSWWQALAPDGSGGVVFPPDAPINYSDIAWRPDGRRFAFVNYLLGSYGIETAAPDGRDVQRLTDGVNDLWPSWSPDGSKIVFASTRDDPAQNQCTPGDTGSMALLCPTDLYVMDADGRNVTRLTATERPESTPVWSPDGSTIAFTAGTDDGSGTAVFVMNADGTNVRQVSSGGRDFGPSWSPDGSQLAFTAIRNDWGVWAVHADGTGEHLLVGDTGPYAEGPKWSPDGSAIAFVGDPKLVGDDAIGAVLLAMNTDGSSVRLLAQVPRYDIAGDIAWQPVPAGTSPPRIELQPLPYRAVVTDTIDTGLRFPEGVVVGEGAVWVVGSGLDGTGEGDLLRLNRLTGQIEARIRVGSVPGWEFGGAGIATGLGSVWLTGIENAEGPGCCDTIVSRIDPRSNSVAETIHVGPGSDGDVWVDETGIWVLAFASDKPELVLYHIDADTHEVVSSIEIPADWSQTVFDAGGWIWVLGNTDNSDGAPPGTLFQIDPNSDQIVTRFEPAQGASFSMAPSGERLWFFHDGLRALDATAGDEVVGPVDLPSGYFSGGLVADRQGGVWVVSVQGGAENTGVWHVDVTGQIDGHADENPGDEASGIASAFDPETGSIWVVHYEDTVSRLQLYSP
jgi:hypothetical protein